MKPLIIMKCTKQIVLSLAAALSLGATAFAADPACPLGGPDGGPGGGPGGLSPTERIERMMRRASHRLNLSDAQQTALKEILARHQSELSPLMDRARTERQALRAIVSAETLDETALEKQAAKIAETTRELTIARAHLRADMKSVLSPEQIDTLMQARRQRGGRGARGWGGFGG